MSSVKIFSDRSGIWYLSKTCSNRSGLSIAPTPEWFGQLQAKILSILKIDPFPWKTNSQLQVFEVHFRNWTSSFQNMNSELIRLILLGMFQIHLKNIKSPIIVLPPPMKACTITSAKYVELWSCSRYVIKLISPI